MTRKIATGVVLVLLVLGSISVEVGRGRATGDEKKPAPSLTVQSNTAFATDLYAKLREGKGNLVFSPINISAALMMAEAGARGETEKELWAVLHLPEDRTHVHRDFGTLYRDLRGRKKVKLTLANAVWIQKNVALVADYERRMKDDYAAGMRPVDFIGALSAARREINRWTETQTNGKIKDSLPISAVNPATRFVLSSAIYFKGTWRTRFQKELTEDAEFHLTGDKSIRVPMMRTNEASFRAMVTKDLRAVELPYAGEELAMLIILPSEIDGLAELDRKMTPENLSKLVDVMVESGMQVCLPKFRMEMQFDLEKSLKAMGMKRAFDPALADFSGITAEVKPLFVQSVVHGAFIEVDEEGTEAGGATHVAIGCGAQIPAEFRIDRPFLFLIRDRKTGSILFMGRVVDPTKN